MNAAQSTFAELLVASEPDQQAAEELRTQRRRTLIPLAIAAALLVLWSFAAPLSGAIIAAGQLKVELNRKTIQHQEGGIVRRILVRDGEMRRTIQHQEGGIVRRILVRDGEMVKANQPLIMVGNVRTDAELSLLVDQLKAERIRNARAAAEAALEASFAMPADLNGAAGTAEHYAREQALFAARRRTLDEQTVSIERQIQDAKAQASALSQQIESTRVSAKLAGEELQINEKLVRDGFVQRARLLQLQRDEADYRSRLAQSQSELSLARQRAGELQTRIAQARNQYQQQATDEAKQSAAQVREIEERLRPSTDQADRQMVRAPVDGKVMGMRVSSVGEVIGPREPILDIVPTNEKLVVEAHIRPQDINNVREGSQADVRLSAFDARTTPLLPGKVVFVSADRVTAESGDSWYVASVEVAAASLKDHPEIQLQAGMPAELFVKTSPRTLFQYLTKPFIAFSSRAMREP